MIVLGLGSNIGDRLLFLKKAVAMIAQDPGAFVTGPRLSAVYESQALLPPGAPVSWELKYLNMALAGDTKLSPEALLAAVKDVERKLGRVPTGYWGPREIDIDILAYDDLVVNSEDLVIPQRELLHRDFAMIPMQEVAPGWAYPVEGSMKGKTVKEMVKSLGMTENYALTRTHHKIKP